MRILFISSLHNSLRDSQLSEFRFFSRYFSIVKLEGIYVSETCGCRQYFYLYADCFTCAKQGICNEQCEVVAFDTGSKRIPVLLVSADTLTNMRLSIAPNHAAADSTFYSVCVIDSMLNGSAEITVTDSLGNSAIQQYEYCTIADTHAPLVQLLYCNDSAGTPCIYQVSDTQAWDRGLDTVYFTNVKNISIGLDTAPVDGSRIATFATVGNGSFCVTAIDLAGNRFDTCFGNTASVSVPAPIAISLSISPNPTSGDVSISIEGAPSADVEIFDVLG